MTICSARRLGKKRGKKGTPRRENSLRISEYKWMEIHLIAHWYESLTLWRDEMWNEKTVISCCSGLRSRFSEYYKWISYLYLDRWRRKMNKSDFYRKIDLSGNMSRW
jgi:hypothetical protein